MGLLAQNAMALPDSSLDDGKWGGYKTYSNDDGLDVTVVFNVYDKDSGEFTWGGGVDIPSTDQYIYVYEVYNTSDTLSISSFSVLNSDGSSVLESLINSTCSQEDSSGDGISPDPSVSETQGVWVWSAGVGLLVAGDHSWYLIYSSAYAPTTGDFAVVAADESDISVPEVPEPATLALFGIASALYAAKRRKKRQAE